jgi:hypothetical protein
MLQTVEAEVDVNGNVRLLEPLRVTKPTRALLTLLEDAGEPVETQGNAAALLEFLRNNRLPESARPNVEEIEAQIEENRNSSLTLREDTIAPAEDQGAATELLKLLRGPEFANRRSFAAEEIEERIEEGRNSWDRDVNESKRRQQLEWLKAHREEYAGLYVALDGDRLVGKGKTILEARAQARQNGVENPFLMRMTSENEILPGGW